MKDCLESLAIETHNLDNPAALLDGGDVMFTGKLDLKLFCWIACLVGWFSI